MVAAPSCWFLIVTHLRMPRLASAALQLVAAACLLLAPAVATVRQTDSAHTITLGFMQYLVDPTTPNLTSSIQDAMELYVAAQLAIDDINANKYEDLFGISILEGYTLELDVQNTYYMASQAMHITTQMLDPLHSDAPPPMILGFVGEDEMYAALTASQPWQTPLLTPSVTTGSLTALYPNLNRYCATDQLEAMALISVFNTFGWTKVAILFNNDGGTSSQLVQGLQQFSGDFTGSLAPDLVLTAQSYIHQTGIGAAMPDITAQLQALKDADSRVIVLSGYADDMPGLLTQAKAMSMTGEKFTLVGTNQWCFNNELHDDAVIGPMLNGLLCTQNHYDPNNTFHKRFVASWEAKYAANPVSTYNIATPSLSSPAYDQVFAAAFALQAVLELRRECNISATGSNGRPFSGLLPPDMDAFNGAYMYTAGLASSGNLISYVTSTVPITAPAVCPWLLYQTGQGRVLNRILRTQQFQASTGPVSIFDSGDRIAEFSLFNIYDGVRTPVATISTEEMFYQFYSVAVEASIPVTVVPEAPTMPTGNVSEAWRATYDSSTFSTIMNYAQAYLTISLATGQTFESNVFTEWYPTLLKFADGTSTVPLDAPITVTVIEGIDKGARDAVFVLCALAAIYTCLLLGFQIKYRKEKSVKMTSPTMNVVFLMGSLGVLIYIVLLGLDSYALVGGVDGYVQLCHIKFALLPISFSLAFGSLFAKTYRVDAIVNSKHLHVRVVRDRDILLIVAALVGIDIVGILTWQTSSPFHRSLSTDTAALNPSNIDEMQTNARERCSSNNFTIFVIAFLVYKGVLLLLGVILAMRVRKINIPNLNDAKWIVLSIYQVFLLSILLIVIALVVIDQPTAFYLIVAIGMLYLVVVVLSLLFVPRILTLLWNYNFEEKSSGGISKQLHADTSSENNALRMEGEKLKIRIQTVQHELADVRRQALAQGVILALAARSPPGSNGMASSNSTGQQGVSSPSASGRLDPATRAQRQLASQEPRSSFSNLGGSLGPRSPLSQASQAVSPKHGPTVHLHVHTASGDANNHHRRSMSGQSSAMKVTRRSAGGPLPGTVATNSSLGTDTQSASGFDALSLPPPVLTVAVDGPRIASHESGPFRGSPQGSPYSSPLIVASRYYVPVAEPDVLADPQQANMTPTTVEMADLTLPASPLPQSSDSAQQ